MKTPGMSSAIALSVQNETSQPIVRLWDQVAAFEPTPSMQALGYRPHFTFTIYEDIAADVLQETVRRVFANEYALRIQIDSIQYFDANPLVLWASPQNDSKLRALHNAIHAHIDPDKCHPLYRPDTWIPHCTLGTQIGSSQRDAAIAFASEKRRAFEVVFDTIDWVTFPPVHIIGSITLPGA